MKKIFGKYIIVLALVCLLLSAGVFAASYEIYVGGVQVTDENAHDVLGDTDAGETVTYDGSSNTLTLNNADISGFYRDNNHMNNGILSYNKINIELVGDNKISVMPEGDEIREMAIGIHAVGGLNMNAEQEASLYIEVGEATRENFGFYVRQVDDLVDCYFTGKINLEVKLSDFIITDYFYEPYQLFGNSICIHCEGSMYILDDTSIKCTSGSNFAPEDSGFVATTDDINSGGTSVGIVAFGGKLVFDTTGTVDIYVNDCDGKRAGVFALATLEIRNGTVNIEMSESDIPKVLSATAAYIDKSSEYCFVALSGETREDVSVGDLASFSLAGLPITYCVNSDGTEAMFTALVTTVVGAPSVDYDANGNPVVTVPVENEEKAENALVVFAAYNEYGRMTDVKFENGALAVDGKISTDLDISDAVRVTVFVFDNASSMMPLSHQIEITGLT